MSPDGNAENGRLMETLYIAIDHCVWWTGANALTHSGSPWVIIPKGGVQGLLAVIPSGSQPVETREDHIEELVSPKVFSVCFFKHL